MFFAMTHAGEITRKPNSSLSTGFKREKKKRKPDKQTDKQTDETEDVDVRGPGCVVLQAEDGKRDRSHGDGKGQRGEASSTETSVHK